MGNDIRKIRTNTKFGWIESRQEKIEGMKIMTESSSLFMFGWNEMRGELFNLFEKRKEIFFGKRM